MRLARLLPDRRGASAVEFGLTAPAFFMLLAGIVDCGMLLWTQLGLQHGTEMAARCASVNSALCGDVGSIQTYAAQQTYGLNPPSSTFSVAVTACGNQVSATYGYQFMASYFGVPALTLNAQSCFPI